MAIEYAVIPSHSVDNCVSYVQPCELSNVVHLDDPASLSFFDFQQFKPLTVSLTNSLSEAQLSIEANELHVALVVNELGHLVGLISLENILGAEPLKVQQTLGIKRKELQVKHIMMPMEKLVAIDYTLIKVSKIGHLLNTFHALQQQILLVQDELNGQPILRGLFTDTQLSRQLGTNIRQLPKELSVADLQRLVHPLRK